MAYFKFAPKIGDSTKKYKIMMNGKKIHPYINLSLTEFNVRSETGHEPFSTTEGILGTYNYGKPIMIIKDYTQSKEIQSPDGLISKVCEMKFDPNFISSLSPDSFRSDAGQWGYGVTWKDSGFIGIEMVDFGYNSTGCFVLMVYEVTDAVRWYNIEETGIYFSNGITYLEIIPQQTFSINTYYPHEFKAGMTWEEWCNSDYNDLDAFILYVPDELMPDSYNTNDYYRFIFESHGKYNGIYKVFNTVPILESKNNQIQTTHYGTSSFNIKLFKIDEDTFCTAPGMTWQEWCNSYYNEKWHQSLNLIEDNGFFIAFTPDLMPNGTMAPPAYYENEYYKVIFWKNNSYYSVSRNSVNYNITCADAMIEEATYSIEPLATNKIFFKADNYYCAEVNMTWQQWCDSSYNTIGARIGQYGVHLYDEDFYTYHINVDANELIQDKQAYTISRTYYGSQ